MIIVHGRPGSWRSKHKCPELGAFLFIIRKQKKYLAQKMNQVFFDVLEINRKSARRPRQTSRQGAELTAAY